MSNPDLERRFGGLRRLHGDAAYERLRRLRIAVVGLGGVGSWAVEALARSGVASLTLIDLDHVAESNINRQVQALGRTVGMSKVRALRERVADIHPGCLVHGVEEFADAGNWPGLLTEPVDVVIDACDQVSAKLALAVWALDGKRSGEAPLVMVGAAGGKQLASGIEAADLSDVTHDPLLASLRQRVRRHLRSASSSGQAAQQQAPMAASEKKPALLGLRCVFSREAVKQPWQVCDLPGGGEPGADAVAAHGDGSLNCHGYGSSVMVTAAFGMVAAQEAVRCGLLKK